MTAGPEMGRRHQLCLNGRGLRLSAGRWHGHGACLIRFDVCGDRAGLQSLRSVLSTAVCSGLIGVQKSSGTGTVYLRCGGAGLVFAAPAG